MRMLNPPHPGDFIRTEIIEPIGLSVTAAAKVLGVSRPTLSSLLNGK
ncbi:MAG: helix-turn-helix domain-containing protein, partial [Nitrospirota bacterium]|nr:helix-turn-helix domain-containing protein [Nitrospirota bacterium]